MKQSLSSGSEQQVRQSQTTANNRSATSEAQSFVDNRPQTIAQRQLINTIHASPQMITQRQQAGSIHNSPRMAAQRELSRSLQSSSVQLQVAPEEEMLRGKFEAVQRVEEEEESLQGKFEMVQRVEEEEPLQGKFEAVQRVEEEEPLQGKFAVAQRVEAEEPLQGKFDVAQRAQQSAAKPNNTGLPDNLKSGIEHLSGMSMDHVKVHYNSSQPAQLNALAYAQGADIHVASGQEQHLPHEAWHVVQQAQGRVRPTMQMKDGVPINDDKGLEQEADEMGAKALAPALQFSDRLEGEQSLQSRSGTASLKKSFSGAAPKQLMQVVERSLDGSETVVFDHDEHRPDASGLLGTDGYIYTLIETSPGGKFKYRRKIATFKGYGTFMPREPVVSETFAGHETMGLEGLAAKRRASKMAEYMRSAGDVGSESRDQSEPLVSESDSLKKHRIRKLEKDMGVFAAGKVINKVTGLPVSGVMDTLKTEMDSFKLAPSKGKDGYEPVRGNENVEKAKSEIARFLSNKAKSKGVGVGGALGGALLGTAVLPIVGTIAGGILGGKAASKATDKVTSADEQVDEVRSSIQILHVEARKGDADAFSALLDLGLSEDVVRASDGWKAAIEALGL